MNAQDEPLKAGDHFGDFTVERMLGKGGMATVYLVRSPDGSPFAVKIMHPDKMTHDLRRRFAHEAEFAMKIRHKNLISVYDVGEDPDTGLCYIIMDYVPGGTLADLIKKHGRLPVGQAVKIAMQVAAALEVAHRNGLVHRDVKPDNIMFAEDGTPKLADLGVAKFESDSNTMVTVTGVIIGTPAYMSPEQLIDSHKIDARADIYSLGVVLYEMLSGKRPNSGSTAVELLAKAIKGEELPDIRTMHPEISASVAHVLSLMCAPKPEDRPATSIDAARLLQKAATGNLVLPKKSPSAAEAQKRKRPIPVAAVAALAAVLAVCGILYYSGRNSANPRGTVPEERHDSSSYVQDGLVAMWDGIENAGKGKHDQNAKVWKNLAGVPDAEPVDCQAMWCDNAALLGIGRYFRVNSLFENPQQITVEVCHRATPTTESSLSALFSSCQFGGIGFQGVNGSQWSACVANPAGGYYTEIKLPVLQGKAETLAFTVGDAFTVYRDAKVFGLTSGIRGIRYNEKYTFQIGRDPGNDDYITGEIYSIRVYSRPLSSSEIRRNHEIDRVRFGLDKVAQATMPAAATAKNGGRKTTVLIPRLDRSPKAWVYSFNEEQGWQRPNFDDAKWKRAPGGFGAREHQSQLEHGRMNTKWDTKRIFLRRHFNWSGGNVSRVVADIFHDDGVNLYLNGAPIFSVAGANSDWIPHEIPATRFAKALKIGDNVFCAEAVNDNHCQYFDCGLIVECGGEMEKPLNVPNGIRKVKTEAGTWTIKVENGVAQIGDGRNVALDPLPKGKLVIPSELDGLTIRKLAQDCFKRCDEIESVVISEGIRSIGQRAFFNCSRLHDISIPESLERLGWESLHRTMLSQINLKNTRLIEGSVFKFCGQLEKVDVNQDNLSFTVKDGVLYDKIHRAVVFCPRSRQAYEFPAGIEYIYDAAFTQCKIKAIEIPETIVAIGDCAFEACPQLESVKFRGDDVILSDWAFGNIPTLKSISWPPKMKSLDAWAIFNRAGFESVTLPDTVETIGVGVFERCPELKRINLGKSLRNVKLRAFAGCRKLAEITFPKTLEELTTETFMGCQSLGKVFFAGNAPALVNYENRSGCNIYMGANKNLVTYVSEGSTGWLDNSAKLPNVWPVEGGQNARAIKHMGTPIGNAKTSVYGPDSTKAAPTAEAWRPGPTSEWFVEWDKALQEAKKTGKKIFALNTGSDWCHWCKKLKADVLDKPEFSEFAAQNLVLLYLDSPNRNPLGKEQKTHNKLIVRTLPFGGGVPSVSVFTASGTKLGSINGGGMSVGDYLKRLKAILDGKGEPVSGDNAKVLFTDGGCKKLLAKAAAERAKLPPVAKNDFKAQLTGVTVCDATNRKFDGLEFSPPTTYREVPAGKMAVFRVEYDFPKGYAAAVWVLGRGSLYSNPSGRYPGKGVAYGFLGLHDTRQDIKLNSIDIRTNSEPELDDYPRGWTICTPKVDLLFLKKGDEPATENKPEGIQTAKANGYDWRYKLDENNTDNSVASYISKSKLHADYRSKERNRVFVEVCHSHYHENFKTPPYTLDRVKEAISSKADILHFLLCMSKDGVLFSAERENLENISDGIGSPGDYSARQLKRFKVKQHGELTTKTFATFEEMLKLGKGKILFKVSGACDYAEALCKLLNKLDAWESVVAESWNISEVQNNYGLQNWNKIRSGELQIMVGGGSFNEWKDAVPECSVWGQHDNLEAHGLKGIPQRIVVAFVYGPGEANRTDDERGWGEALKDGATVFRTNRPVDLVKYLRKCKRWK